MAQAQNLFQGLVGLQDPDRPGDHSQDPGFLAARDRPGGRWLREQAPVAGASIVRFESAELSIKPQDSPGDEGFLFKIAGVIDQEPSGEVVASVEDQIIIPDDLPDIGRSDPFGMDTHVNFRVQRPEGFPAGSWSVSISSRASMDSMKV